MEIVRCVKEIFVKKRLLFIIMVLLILIILPSCSGKKEKKIVLIYGTYTMAGTDSQIVLKSDNTLVVRNYDLSKLEKEAYENFMIAMRNDRREEGNKLTEEEEQKIRDDINLERQFLDRENSFDHALEDGLIGIYVPVENCDLYFYLQFYPSDNTIVFDDKIFTLEKS